jgi:hypothetical protein
MRRLADYFLGSTKSPAASAPTAQISQPSRKARESHRLLTLVFGLSFLALMPGRASAQQVNVSTRIEPGPMIVDAENFEACSVCLR